MPRVDHRKRGTEIEHINLEQVKIGDTSLFFILPHELCPVDGVVTEGRGVMDESYSTGELYFGK